MFWSGNYVANKDLTNLLKAETVNLTDVLEADNILQECKADNQALTKFLSRPEILSELIRLITEEPPKDVDLMLQYRHANIACEVIASFTSKMKQLLVKNVSLLHRLCDFVNRDPPLNPLLASYFSKVIEVLLEKDPSQNGYVYRIVCLQVLDVFCSRGEFLPNLLRHMATSAIADLFKYFIRLEDYFYKGVMQWFEDHKLVDCLIRIVAGTYDMEESAIKLPPDQSLPEEGEGEGEREEEQVAEATEDDERAIRSRERMRTAAAVNAEALLRELLLIGCVKDPYDKWSDVARSLAVSVRLGVDRALSEWFSRPEPRTSPPAGLIVAALTAHASSDQHSSEDCSSDRAIVEYHVAQHLPLIHQQLMKDPQLPGDLTGAGGRAVGSCRLALCTVLGELATSHVHDVPNTLLTLGTPGLLVDLFFSFPLNNLLHQAVYGFVSRAVHSPYALQFAQHLLVECDVLTRLMNAFEENEKRSETGMPRAGYMGHVILLLSLFRRVLEQDGAMADIVPEEVQARWHSFTTGTLDPVLHIHQTPLGGVYPSDNSYEEPAEMEPETVYDNIVYDKDSSKMMDIDRDIEWSSKPDDADFDAVLDDVPPELLEQSSPWESLNQDADLSNEQWANFNEVFCNSDPFANANEQTFQLPNHMTDNMNQVYEATNQGFDFANQNFLTNDNLVGDNKSKSDNDSLVTQNEGFDNTVPTNIFENSLFTNRRLDFDDEITLNDGEDEKCDKGSGTGETKNIGLDWRERDDSVEFNAQSAPSWSYSASVSNDCDEDAAITNLANIIRSLNISQASECDANVVSLIPKAEGVSSDAETGGETDPSETSLGTDDKLVEGNLLGTNEQQPTKIDTTKDTDTDILTKPQDHSNVTSNVESEIPQITLPVLKAEINAPVIVQNTTDLKSLSNSTIQDSKDVSSSIKTDNSPKENLQSKIKVNTSEFEQEKNIVKVTEQLLDDTEDLLAKTGMLLSEAAKDKEKPEVNSNIATNETNLKTNIADVDPIDSNVNLDIAKSEPSVNPNIADLESNVNLNIAKPEPSVNPKIAETEPSER